MSRIHAKTGNYCPVCCEDLQDDGIVLHKTRRQTHKLCVECGTAYLTPLITQAIANLQKNIRHKTEKIRCPGTFYGKLRNQCSTLIDVRDISVPVNTQLFDDITRIRYVLGHPNVYLCPECGEFVVTHPDDPILHTECLKCNYIWCRGCQTSPYHEEMSCAEYEAVESKTETGKLIWEKKERGDLKFCPQCRTPTEKVRGQDGRFIACNKVICTQCKIKWCWLCEEANIDYTHFNSTATTRCANKLWEGVDTS